MKIKWFSLIRITGLVLVLGYHFFARFLPGGFIGVDIFFVFSGYLITSLALSEIERTHHFDLLKYYQRRFVRIFPPLVIMLLITMPMALLLPQDFRAGLVRQFFAALSFATAKYELVTGTSYEAQQTPQFYIHTWTLSLEFLFYLIWGLLIFILIQLLLRNPKIRLFQASKMLLALASVVLVVVSIIALEVGFDLDNGSKSYFSFLAHMYPFFIGSFVATTNGISLTAKKQARFKNSSLDKNLIKLGIGLLLLLVMAKTLHFDSVWTFRLALIATSLIAASLIKGLRRLHEQTEEISEPPILGILADTSYSVYLFHWPVWLVLSELIASSFSAGFFAGVISFALSYVVYYKIEPYFHGQQLKLSRIKLIAVGGLAVVSLVLTLVSLVQAPGLSKIAQGINESRISKTLSDVNKLGQLGENLNTTALGTLTNTAWYYPEAGFTAGEVAFPQQQYLKNLTVITDKVLDSTQTFVGDSVMVGALTYISAAFPDSHASATVGDNFDVLTAEIEQAIADKSLGKYLVVGGGANVIPKDTSQAQYEIAAIDKIISMVPKGTRLIFITPYDGRNMTGTNVESLSKLIEYERSLPQKYPWITIVDWAAYIGPQDSRLWADRTHFGGIKDVTEDYMNQIIEGMNKASEGAAKS